MFARWIVSLLLIGVAGVAAADRYEQYFQIAYRTCSTLYPPDTVSASFDSANARESCYAAQVSRALAMLPPDSPQMLVGALQAAPDYARVAFESALKAGIDPYFAVTTATQTLPQHSETFANRAIQFGADPSQVTEATAAGYRRERP